MSMLGPGPPILVDPPTTRHNKGSAEREMPSTSKKHHDQDGSTILRIPKVSMPSSTSVPIPVTSPVPSMPTKLRVRKDLMYLGLMANAPAPQTAAAPTSQHQQQHQQLKDP